MVSPSARSDCMWSLLVTLSHTGSLLVTLGHTGSLHLVAPHPPWLLLTHDAHGMSCRCWGGRAWGTQELRWPSAFCDLRAPSATDEGDGGRCVPAAAFLLATASVCCYLPATACFLLPLFLPACYCLCLALLLPSPTFSCYR